MLVLKCNEGGYVKHYNKKTESRNKLLPLLNEDMEDLSKRRNLENNIKKQY